MYRKVYEVTGYVDEGSLYCPDCARKIRKDYKDTMSPIFLGSEFDYSPVCDVCLEEIEVVVLEDEVNV